VTSSSPVGNISAVIFLSTYDAALPSPVARVHGQDVQMEDVEEETQEEWKRKGVVRGMVLV
jgi:hypothetical protein